MCVTVCLQVLTSFFSLDSSVWLSGVEQEWITQTESRPCGEKMKKKTREEVADIATHLDTGHTKRAHVASD